MTGDALLVQLLGEAHAQETSLGQALAGVDEAYADVARSRADRIEERLVALGDTRRGRRQAYAVAQTALGQLAAAGRGPVDRLLGGGPDARALRSARDALAETAYAVGTYAALEALANDAADVETAGLAREHHDAHDKVLDELRARIPGLARVAATTPPPEPSDLVRAATERARQAAEEVRARLPQEPKEDVEEPAEPALAAGELPIPGYAKLRVGEVLPRLDGLSPAELDAIETYERMHRSRRRVLAEIARLRTQFP